VARDINDEGRLLWIPDSKTEAGRRTLEVPEVVQPYLVALAAGRQAEEKIFGRHWRDWVRKNVRRICREAKVVEVTAHGMRGLHATLAVRAGMTGHAVAAALGHESVTTTYGNYATASAVEGARQKAALMVLSGGRR
jgi:integrase